MRYAHATIEKKWRAKWAKNKKLAAASDFSKKPKRYVLDMFPYPSGEGLHVGHVEGYTATDILSRYLRMNGYNVLHPIGWDAFGLPAENFAIKNKIHPAVVTKRNIANFKRQIQALGFSYDWSREINTTDPEYYKWTQWIFLKLFEKGLAYEAELPINFCPSCKTGLANEEVVDGACERCGTKVVQKKLRQWVLKITAYADRLLADLDGLDWPERVIAMQRNWIGRSEGAEVIFKLKVSGQPDVHTVKVFTTRPDTLFGATFVAVSPECAQKWLDVGWKASDEVKRFIADELARRAQSDRAPEIEKRGMFSGVTAVNPANQKEIPVWVVNYVLADVGTGAIMAVPAHDERDYAFAKKYNIPIVTVIEPITGEPKANEQYRKSIVAVVENPATGKFLSIDWGEKLGGNLFIGGGLEEGEDVVETAMREIREETGYGNVVLVSRSETVHHHYFAASKNVARAIDATGLYFRLENDERVEPKLEADEQGKFSVEWLSKNEAAAHVRDPLHKYIFEKLVLGRIYTGDGVITGSGKFDGTDSKAAKKAITEFVGGKMVTTYKLRDWNFSRQRYWGEPIPIIRCANCGNVPLAEKDLPLKLPNVKNYEPTGTGESPLAAIDKWVKVKCPKCKGPAKRETNTMPQWAGSCWYYLRYLDPKNKKKLVDPKKEKYWMGEKGVDVYVGGAEHAVLHLLYARFWHKFLYDIGVVSTKEPFHKLMNQGMVLGPNGVKMSKSKGNVVNPDEVVAQYGADVLRMYEMFMGPFEDAKAWDPKSIVGIRRFVERVYALREKADKKIKAADAALHKTIKKATDDIAGFKFNTAISAMMVLLNDLEKRERVAAESFAAFVKLLAPFAPYLAEELWSTLGKKTSVHAEQWPAYDEKLTVEEEFDLVVQVNGRVRDVLRLPRGIAEADAITRALASEKAAKFLEGKPPKKTIFVKDRLINFIV